MCDVEFLKNIKERIIMLEILQWKHDGKINKPEKTNRREFISDVYIGEFDKDQSIKILNVLNIVYGNICRYVVNNKVKIYLEKMEHYGIGASEDEIKNNHDLLWNKTSFLI